MAPFLERMTRLFCCGMDGSAGDVGTKTEKNHNTMSQVLQHYAKVFAITESLVVTKLWNCSYLSSVWAVV